jgi:hypothetical protein
MNTLVRDKPCLVLEFNARRCRDAEEFLEALKSVYGTLRYVDYGGNSIETTPAQLTTDRFGEDWLLHLDHPDRA